MAEIILVVKTVDYDYFTGGGCMNEALAVQISLIVLSLGDDAEPLENTTKSWQGSKFD